MAENIMNTRCCKMMFIILLFCSCNNEKWSKTKSGMLFKVYAAESKDSVAKEGDVIKMNYVMKIRDSVVESSLELMPSYAFVVTDSNDYDPSAVYAGLKKGDSVVVKQRVDSMLKKKILLRLPWYTNEYDEWVTTIKVLDVFHADSMAKKDKEMEEERIRASQIELSRRRLLEMFKQKSIQVAEIDKGVFLRPVVTGNGNKPSAGDEVSLELRIRTLRKGLKESEALSGKIESFRLGIGDLPATIEQAVMYSREGDHIKLYAPAVIVFGFELRNKGMRVDDDLEVDIRVREVGEYRTRNKE